MPLRVSIMATVSIQMIVTDEDKLTDGVETLEDGIKYALGDELYRIGSPFEFSIETESVDGIEILVKITEELERQDINLLLARMDPEYLELFGKMGALDVIGAENIFATVRSAVEAAQQSKESGISEEIGQLESSTSQDESE